MITVEVPPEFQINSNRKYHWANRMRRVRYLRGISLTLAQQALQQHKVRRMQQARVIVTVQWPNLRRRDVHNLGPTFKACIDGFVDAGLLPDDNDKHLVGPDPRVAAEPHNRRLWGQPWMGAVLTFTFEELNP